MSDYTSHVGRSKWEAWTGAAHIYARTKASSLCGVILRYRSVPLADDSVLCPGCAEVADRCLREWAQAAAWKKRSGILKPRPETAP